MDVFKNGVLGYLAGFLILAALIVAIVLVTTSSNESSSSPEIDVEWVAVGDGDLDGNRYGNIMYSNDGKTWTKTSTGNSFSIEGYGVAYGTCNGVPLWVAVGDDADVGFVSGYGSIMYSTDGQSWTKTSTGDSFSGFGYGVAYGTCNGVSLWVAVGDGDLDGNKYGNIMYSTNGQSWTKTSTGDSFNLIGYGVAYGTCNGSSLWVAVGADTGYGCIMYSNDGQSWTKTSTGDSFSSLGFGVAYGTCNGVPLWVAVGTDIDGSGPGVIMYSSDGQSWTKTSTGDSFSISGYGVAYGTCNGVSLWVAVGDGGGGYGSIMYSNDGQSWTKTSTGDSFSNYGNAVAYGTRDGVPLWVAVGDDQDNVGDSYGSIMYSNDGQSWTKTSTGNIFSVLGNGVAAKHLLYGMDPTYYTN